MTERPLAGAPYSPRADRKEIVFVRHAQSVANAEGIWNGRSDGPLSPAGEATLDMLGRRLAHRHFDVVISSPLSRATATASSFADDFATDEDFVEIDLGEWEGMAFTEVQERHGEELAEALSRRDLPMGRTGETIDQAAKRALRAADGLFDRLGAGQRAAVVTHGGFLESVLHRHLAGRGRRPHAFVTNTAITKVVWQYGRPRLATFNDTGHLGPLPLAAEGHIAAGNPVMALIRHGRTLANLERRWQGHGDWDLDEVGMAQAEALGAWYGALDTVYSSPLKRAWSTAQRVAADGAVAVADLRELNMGKWEGLTSDEIAAGWPGVMETIYRDGIDLRRGETGESWGELTARIANALDDIDPADGAVTGVVSHGGAIRAYVSSLTTVPDTHAESLYTPANTSVTHVALTDRGPELVDYAVAVHLEDMQ